MSIRLRKETEALINETVDSGAYRSAEDLVDAAVRHHLEMDQDTDQLLASIPDLQKKIQEGRASPLIPAEDVFSNLYERQRQIERDASS